MNGGDVQVAFARDPVEEAERLLAETLVPEEEGEEPGDQIS